MSGNQLSVLSQKAATSPCGSMIGTVEQAKERPRRSEAGGDHPRAERCPVPMARHHVVAAAAR